MNSIYDNDIEVRQLTREAIATTKSRLLQIHRFAAWDDLHARILLEIFKPKLNACIADVGCGVGAMADLMSIQRPDLHFTLINRSQAQLDMCPNGFVLMQGTAEDLPLNNAEVDAVMVTYALGHFDLSLFLMECDRVLKPDGHIYIYDIFRTQFPCRYGKDLGYYEFEQDELIEAFKSHGFKFSHSRTTTFALPLVAGLMPNKDTLKNTISAAMVFEKK